MPVIDRPNTDAQRLEALQTAKNKADVTLPANLAFSAATLATLNAFLPLFEAEVLQRGAALSAQAASTSLFDIEKGKLKLFTSHFFQVFNLGIARGVYTADQRAFFQLNVGQEDLPVLNTEQQIQLWAGRIVAGDAARVTAGGAPMLNPTAAQVLAQQTAYTNAQGDQTTKKDAYDLEQEDVATMRPTADALISDIWDEVEFTFRKDEPSSKRRKAREYGVVYRPRTGETPSPDDFSIIGKVKDIANGLPLGDVTIYIDETGMIYNTDAQGNYFIGVMAAGTYTLHFLKNGYDTKDQPGVIVANGAITTVDVQLAATTTGRVIGTVAQGATNPPATVTVAGFTANPGADGSYEIKHVPPGPQTVQAWLNSAPGTVQSQNITVTVGGTVTVDFNF